MMFRKGCYDDLKKKGFELREVVEKEEGGMEFKGRWTLNKGRWTGVREGGRN